AGDGGTAVDGAGVAHTELQPVAVLVEGRRLVRGVDGTGSGQGRRCRGRRSERGKREGGRRHGQPARVGVHRKSPCTEREKPDLAILISRRSSHEAHTSL